MDERSRTPLEKNQIKIPRISVLQGSLKNGRMQQNSSREKSNKNTLTCSPSTSAIQVVLLILSWSLAKVAPEKDQNADFDQLATASEIISTTTNKPEELQRPDVGTKLGNKHQHPGVTTVRYENSNGFIPMIPLDTQPNRVPKEAVVDPSNIGSSRTNGEKSGVEIAEDPAYSTEARIFLSLTQPGQNRRSFNPQNDQSQFELLKVNNDTPAVANYREFYEAVKNQRNGQSASPGRQFASEEDPRTKASSGSKALDPYTSSYRDSFHRGTVDSHSRYQNYATTLGRNQQKASSQREKVQPDYRRNEKSNYGFQGESQFRQEVAESVSSDAKSANSGLGMYDGRNRDSSLGRTEQVFSNSKTMPNPKEYNLNFGHSTMKTSTPATYSSRYQDTSRSTTKSPLKSSHSQLQYRFSNDEVYAGEDPNRNFDRSEEFSDEDDYYEVTERPRRTQKSRRKPYNSRRPSKEHRNTMDEGADPEESRTRHSVVRPKLNRHRSKSNSWYEDDRYQIRDESAEEQRAYESRNHGGSDVRPSKSHGGRSRKQNTWTQLTPNLEISHSSGIEINPRQKSKMVVPVKVNLVPMTHFDHTTALGNSQGFDASNAILQNIVPGTPLVSTPNPVLSTSPSLLGQGYGMQNGQKSSLSGQNFGFVTPVPDVIVGQNSFQTPVQTLLMTPTSDRGKIVDGFRNSYMSSTMTPLFTVTSSIPMQTLHSTVAPQAMYPTSQSLNPSLQHLRVNQIQPNHGLVMTPATQTIATNLQVPLQGESTYHIQVNPNGLHGQNPVQNSPNIQTTHGIQMVPSTFGQTGLNFFSTNPNYKKNVLPVQFIHTFREVASKVQNGQGGATTLPNISPNGFTVHNRDQNQQILKAANEIFENTLKQLQQLHRNQAKGNKYGTQTVGVVDNTGSNSNINPVNTVSYPANVMGKAQLPIVGTSQVEILNPNIKPSPLDPYIMNNLPVRNYPAVVTTSIPIFGTSNYATVRPIVTSTGDPVNVQGYVDSLTEIGSRGNSVKLEIKPTGQSQERVPYNPIEFVPNLDVIRTQKFLNSKLPQNEPVMQGLSLVPAMPGGSFFKSSSSVQNEVSTKPKLNSDLEKFAEEMFKESLKTIYNSHKWNNDHRPISDLNVSETMDLHRLKDSLQNLKAAFPDLKTEDILEAHFSENKPRSAKKPESTITPTTSASTDLGHSHHGRPVHGHSRPANYHPRDFLTPPKFHSFVSKSPFHEKPIKNRPGHGPPRYKSHSRPGGIGKIGGPESAASNTEFHVEGARFEALQGAPQFERDQSSEFKKRPSFGEPPSFTTSFPTSNPLKTGSNENGSSKEGLDLNHPRTHNLFGLLMKNKQLPPGSSQSLFRDRDEIDQFFENEKKRLDQQFYDETLRNFQQRGDFPSTPKTGVRQDRNLSRPSAT
ncbi:uncharacterized protein LOC105698599 [Orussus abietinus]|uniref:uncharacterized protein LOC105698599 n=1 Tax=Orussus abietinus TaxID=222816 RepID=UPI000C715D70|nr:uncharacterized protein LOC105698599 [Orussus abietinus]